MLTFLFLQIVCIFLNPQFCFYFGFRIIKDILGDKNAMLSTAGTGPACSLTACIPATVSPLLVSFFSLLPPLQETSHSPRWASWVGTRMERASVVAGEVKERGAKEILRWQKGKGRQEKPPEQVQLSEKSSLKVWGKS